MWLGAVSLVVTTAAVRDAGTDDLITARLFRDDVALRDLRLDFPTEDDHEPGDIRTYAFGGPGKWPRVHDRTPPLPPGIGQSPMPYPGYGFEFSSGLAGHLRLQLRTGGSDMWLKDNVDLNVKEVRQRATSFDTLDWMLDPDWRYLASWPRDVAFSRDPRQGSATWMLVLT